MGHSTLQGGLLGGARLDQQDLGLRQIGRKVRQGGIKARIRHVIGAHKRDQLAVFAGLPEIAMIIGAIRLCL